jgi:Domain of unknown function (DUF4835)
MKIFKIIILLFVAALAINGTQAQEIKPNVIVNFERLEFEARTDVSTLKDDLERYIRSQRFTDIDWEGDPIDVDILIHFISGSKNNYSARIAISSKRMLDGDGTSINARFMENTLFFEYARGGSFSYNTNRYNSLNTLIDFYMLVVIGLDLDTYGEGGGGKVFNLARNVFNIGTNAGAEGYENRTGVAEFNKYNLISELTDIRLSEFRNLVFAYYYDCIDLMSSDEKTAKENLVKTLYDMNDFRRNKLTAQSVLLQLFFDTKAQEICSLLNGHDDQLVFSALMELDPSHTLFYEDARDGKFSR